MQFINFVVCLLLLEKKNYALKIFEGKENLDLGLLLSRNLNSDI